MMTDTLQGGCLCGKVRYEVANRPTDSGYCHCRMCQRNTGAPVVAYASFKEEDFRWIKGAPKVHHSSAEGRRSFCPDCGTYLGFASTLYPGEQSINTTTLDTPAAIPPRRHIFIESRVAWFDVKDDLPRTEGYGEPIS
jgi:hypothetical protein